jgi:predicted RNA-binding protein with PIN domain
VDAVVLVDAENVRRSLWPNMSARELVDRCLVWARQSGARTVVVFDGQAPSAATEDRIEVVGTGRESADDWIVRRAGELAAAHEPYWLVTSDRALRERTGGEAERVIGGGSFVRELADLG